jgi:hypothetical protein
MVALALRVIAAGLRAAGYVRGSGQPKIGHDRQLGRGFIVQLYERNAAFRVGFADGGSNGYVFLANDAWKSLVIGSKYPIEIQFDGKPPWSGNATAKKVGDVTFLYMDFAGQNLINDMAHSYNASIKYGGEIIASISLSRVDAAVEELMRCQSLAGQSSPGSANRNLPPQNAPKRDPFAR